MEESYIKHLKTYAITKNNWKPLTSPKKLVLVSCCETMEYVKIYFLTAKAY